MTTAPAPQLSENPYLKSIGYQPVEESTYTIDHPMVISWTENFHQEFLSRGIFEKFASQHPEKSRARAVVVGSHWHRFSNFVPWILCHAATRVSTNLLRHYVIQIAFEELGMRRADQIHADMFFQTVRDTQGGIAVDYAREEGFKTLPSLDYLKELCSGLTSDGLVLGFLLGMEIPAKENIETVFDSLSFDTQAEEKLSASPFFMLHRQIESEHIRLNVSTFLRFCKAESDRSDFKSGVSMGLGFWEKFWAETSDAVHVHQRQGIPRST